MSDVKLRLVTEQEPLAAQDEDLAPVLAASVERAAVVRFLRQQSARTFGQASLWLAKVAYDIEGGGHVR